MTKIKKIALIILPAFILPLLSGCDNSQTTNTATTTEQNTNTEQDPNQKNTVLTNSNNTSSTNNANLNSPQPTGDQPQLAISGCIGCGRCIQIDPEHFSFSGQKSHVISQDNLDSSKLAQAINSCPAEAISIN